MLTSGLTNAPVSKSFLIYTVASSVALAILDAKHLVSIHVARHLWQYGQFWRALVWQVAGYSNSTEVLFGALLVYQLRVVERMWGSRKVMVRETLPFSPRKNTDLYCSPGLDISPYYATLHDSFAAAPACTGTASCVVEYDRLSTLGPHGHDLCPIGTVSRYYSTHVHLPHRYYYHVFYDGRKTIVPTIHL